ncbi:MAG: hypothetical protein ABWZ74_06645 [Hyphomicrobiaceae bacterium]
MSCMLSVLPEFPVPAHHEPMVSMGTSGSSRADWEANVSRAFQILALRWLDGLLAQYGHLKATCRKNRITVSPVSVHGFAVTLSTEGGRCQVLLGPCREEFGSVADATDYMMAAIRGDLRLRVDLNWRPHRWVVERLLPDGTWIDDAAVEMPEGSHWCGPQDSCVFRNAL